MSVAVWSDYCRSLVPGRDGSGGGRDLGMLDGGCGSRGQRLQYPVKVGVNRGVGEDEPTHL